MTFICVLLSLIFFLGISAGGYFLANWSFLQGMLNMFSWYSAKSGLYTTLAIVAFVILGFILGLPWLLLGMSYKKNKKLSMQLVQAKAKLKKRAKKKVSETAAEEVGLADAYDSEDAVGNGDTRVFTGSHTEE